MNFVDNQLNPFLNDFIDRLSVSDNGVKLDTAYYNRFRTFEHSKQKSYFRTSFDELAGNRKFSNLLIELIQHTGKVRGTYLRLSNNIGRIDSIATAGITSSSGTNG